MAKARQSSQNSQWLGGLLFTGHFTGQCGNAMAKATQSSQSVVSGLLFAGQCGNAIAKAEQSKQSVGRFFLAQ